MSQRPYLCTPLKPIDGKQEPRLIMAGTPSAARLHATKNLYEIKAATSGQVAEFMNKGGKLEQASAAAATGELPGTAPQS